MAVTQPIMNSSITFTWNVSNEDILDKADITGQTGHRFCEGYRCSTLFIQELSVNDTSKLNIFSKFKGNYSCGILTYLIFFATLRFYIQKYKLLYLNIS